MKTPKTRFSLIKDAVWKRISRGIGDHLNKPNFLKNKALQLDIQDWSITIDSYTSNKTLHTRFRAPFINDEKLSIKIFTKGMLGSEMKFFGMQDIIVGHPDIDEKYIIQGNKNNILKVLLLLYYINFGHSE